MEASVTKKGKNLQKYDMLYHILRDQLTKNQLIELDNNSSLVESGMMSDEEFGKILFRIAAI